MPSRSTEASVRTCRRASATAWGWADSVGSAADSGRAVDWALVITAQMHSAVRAPSAVMQLVRGVDAAVPLASPGRVGPAAVSVPEAAAAVSAVAALEEEVAAAV